MFRKLAFCTLTALALSSGGAMAAGGAGYVEDYHFSFEGPFGRFDQNQLQRGLQIYTEVCAACHGLQYVPIRTLSDEAGPGIPEDQVRAYAEQFFVADFDNNQHLLDPETGDLRALTPNDNFPVNNTQNAPDLSLMAKARAGFSGPFGLGLNPLFRGMGGSEYIASLLTHYNGSEREEFGTILYGNDTFSGGYISMGPQLFDDMIEYNDGTRATEEQMALDVAAFLMWTAEPQLMARKQMGFTAVIMLTILSVLLYLTNKRIWAPVKARAKSGQSPAE